MLGRTTFIILVVVDSVLGSALFPVPDSVCLPLRLKLLAYCLILAFLGTRELKIR